MNRKTPPPVHNGFVNLYKPPGITSMDALRRIKGITGQRQKVGHGGTMDPLAQGVLPICFGQATRLMEYVVDGAKQYQMEIELGASTTTYDAEGEVVETGDTGAITRQGVESALELFIGTVEQIPPMYSAVKVGGQRLYKLARAGMEVARSPRTVEIYAIRILDFSLPKLTLTVECGRGVYMRSLAHDLGQTLGCGAYVTDLVRQYCGGFRADEGVTLEELEAASVGSPSGWLKHLYPVDWALRDLKEITVGQQAEHYLRNGQSVHLGRGSQQGGYLERFRAYSADGRFLALVRYDRTDNSWRPIKVFNIAEPSPYAPSSGPIRRP